MTEIKKPKTSIGRIPRTAKKRAVPQPPPLIVGDEEIYARVAQRAYELYQQRGEEHGHDLADWFTAERLVKEELLHGPVLEAPLALER
ncbi:MAG: DUF2934 domain-containing protein [Candidatus Binatia bacterium]